MTKTKKKKSGKRHCNSRQEVLLKLYESKQQQEQAGKPQNRLSRQLQTINTIKPVIEKARKQMAEKNRRESRNDTD